MGLPQVLWSHPGFVGANLEVRFGITGLGGVPRQVGGVVGACELARINARELEHLSVVVHHKVLNRKLVLEDEGHRLAVEINPVDQR